MQCVGWTSYLLLEIKNVRDWHEAVRGEYLGVSGTASEDSKDGEKDEAKPPPYIGGVPPQPQPGQAAPGQQQPPADPSRPPPPPYPGQQKVSPQSVVVNRLISVCPFLYLSYYFSLIHFLRELI